MSRGMRIGLAAVAGVVLVLGGLVACGDDDALSAEDYRAQLDAACGRLTEEFTNLPQVVRDEDLDIEEAEELADDAGNAFNDDVAALEPPDELEDAHDDLLAAFDEPLPDTATPEVSRERALELSELYDAVGAEGCAAGQRATASLIERGSQEAAP